CAAGGSRRSPAVARAVIPPGASKGTRRSRMVLGPLSSDGDAALACALRPAPGGLRGAALDGCAVGSAEPGARGRALSLDRSPACRAGAGLRTDSRRRSSFGRAIAGRGGTAGLPWRAASVGALGG